ncbi:MAG: VWA domain-containing protein [Desulfobacterales bacterium]|jgi:Ca-activated chloride channel family protein
MKQTRLKNFLMIFVLMAATGIAMAYSSNSIGDLGSKWFTVPSRLLTQDNQWIEISGHLIQKKVLEDSDGTVGLNITLKAAELPAAAGSEVRNVDMVIVLDRSGSMKGRKIEDARRAVLELLSSLSAEDRFALITYSDGVHIAADLSNVTDANRSRLASAVNNIRAGGGTNLGAGLRVGMDTLVSRSRSTNSAKVILISDGLANKGLTDVAALANIAAGAVKKEFAVSTVGVGIEFNEHLMTAIADSGTGRYYYLENPSAFAEVFQKEFYSTRTAALTAVRIHIPSTSGISLIDAAGYPIIRENDDLSFYPGNLHSGQTRNLYLTLQVPTNKQRTFELDNIKLSYQYSNQAYEATLEDTFEIACVNSQKKVYSSINKSSWSEKVIKEDFNRLKQEVAADIKSGKKQKALRKIDTYYQEQNAVNAVVGSAEVAENLADDLQELKSFVKDTFEGAPAAVQHKQKSNAKALQFEGYSGRRQ